jgi:translation initiation factor 2-alpha kinase 4
VDILQTLWSHNLSAELAKDARSPEDLMTKHRDDSYSWIIVIKQDAMLKIKSVGKKDIPDVDVPSTQLISWLRSEMRDRDMRALTKIRGGSANHSDNANPAGDKVHDQSVKVLVSQTKSKKFNRRTVVEQAQVSAASLVQTFLNGPILAVETTDQVMDLVQETSLGDPDSWRKVEHGVTTMEKKYVREIHDQLDAWRSNYERDNGTRHAFVYNFRSGHTVYYDLGA